MTGIHIISFFFSSHLRICLLILEREKGAEVEGGKKGEGEEEGDRERETSI